MKVPWACKVWDSMENTPESFWQGLEDFRKLGAKGSELLWKAYLAVHARMLFLFGSAKRVGRAKARG